MWDVPAGDFRGISESDQSQATHSGFSAPAPPPSPCLSVLFSIAERIDEPVVGSFPRYRIETIWERGREMKKKESLLVKAGETRTGSPLNIFGIPIWIKLSGEDTGGAYAIMEDQTPAQQGPPLHRHLREDESFYVIEGEYVFEVDGNRIYAGAGSAVYGPKGTAHRFQNVGTTPGK